MYCIKCGTENANENVFCINCGGTLKPQTGNNQPSSAAPNPLAEGSAAMGRLSTTVEEPTTNKPQKSAKSSATSRREANPKSLIKMGIIAAIILIVIGIVTVAAIFLITFVAPMFAPPEKLAYIIQETSPTGAIVAVNSIMADGGNNQELYSDSDGLMLATNFLDFVSTSPTYLSPDGKTLALVESKTNNLVLLPLENGVPAIIDLDTESLLSIYPAGFSPDSMYFAYGVNTSGSGQTTSFVLTDLNGNEIFNIPGYIRGRFLPNGNQIVVENIEKKGNTSNAYLYSLMLLELPGGEMNTPLVDVTVKPEVGMFGGFFLSSNGKEIYYADEQGLGKIRTDGGDNQSIYSSKNIVHGYALADNANLVLVETDQNDAFQKAYLYLFNIKQNIKYPIDSSLAYRLDFQSYFTPLYQVETSPDARYLAYVANASGSDKELNIVRVKGREKLRLTQGGSWYNFAFAPDRKHIVYIEGYGMEEGGVLYISDLDGKNRIRLDGNVWSFRFIENGKHIIYTAVEDLSNGRPQSSILRIRSDGKQRQVLLDGEDGLYTFLSNNP